MRGERPALGAGELLVSLASRRLPTGIRQERCQEWLAELPVILRDRDAGPAPVRIVRMLAFAADTLRGTAVAPQTYHGAHRGRSTTAKDLRWLGTGLLLLGLLGLLLGGGLFMLAYEGSIVHQLATGPTLTISVTLVLVNIVFFAVACIPGWSSPGWRWWCMSRIVDGLGMCIRAIASTSGWGHPLLFAIISYCGYAISLACIGMAVIHAVRYISRRRHADQGR
jgi:hypothetical protein